jgi:calcineurin-like phosphoesterase
VAGGPVLLCGVVIQIDETTGQAVSIQRIQLPTGQAQ